MRSVPVVLGVLASGRGSNLQAILDATLGAGWRSRAELATEPLREEEACLVALGLWVK